MLGLAGRRTRAGFTGSCARIEDITPTLLHLLGQAVPSYLDGRVLAEMLAEREPVRRKRIGPPDRGDGSTYAPAEASAIERDLRGLGYL
jgi:hypothetical protein